MKNILSIYLIFIIYTLTLYADIGNPLRAMFLMDRLEVQAKHGSPVAWDTRGYIGYDLNKIYIYSEGEMDSKTTQSQNELIYSKAITPFWDAQVGIEADVVNSKTKNWAEIAFQGLAPYFIDTRIRLKFNNTTVSTTMDFEYNAQITQRLILTPRIEINAYSNDLPAMGYGAGLSSLDAGLRLRYEFHRQTAPYIGLQYTKNFGRTSQYQYLNEWHFITGLRFWF